jgi:hypothetical protein
MTAETIAKQVAYGRIAIGAALVLAPKLVLRPWIGEVGNATGARVVGAGFGARDIVVGAGAIHALSTGGPVRPWLLGSAFSDAVDFAATFAGRRALPAGGAAATCILAATGAAASLWTARELGAQPTP